MGNGRRHAVLFRTQGGPVSWRFIPVVSVVTQVFVGCGKEVAPELRVVAPEASLGATITDMPNSLAAVTEGQSLLVLHRLPDDVALDAPIHVRLETPCDAVERDVATSGSSAISAFVAPLGASCSLTVTATVSNSTRVVRITGTAACANLTAICGSAIDAGNIDAATDSGATDAETGE